jgi:hopene-associated glycosyltransferase HpnB
VTALLGAAVASVWLGLLFGHHRFWRNDQGLAGADALRGDAPAVLALVPARNEAATIRASVRSLVGQDYPGTLVVVVVDDASTDGTADLALEAAAEGDRVVHVVRAPPKPTGWSGKVAAQAAGFDAAARLGIDAPWLWLTDADVEHDPDVLRNLVATAEARRATLVSTMVELSTTNASECWLAPAFVYFFQLLYPFPAVNDPNRSEAAAAGGNILISKEMLHRAGGFAAIRDRLIDDVALAETVKRTGGTLWLATDPSSRSLRRYAFGGFARMVARTAFTELRYSYRRLALAVVGLALVFVAPVALVLAGEGLARLLGLVALASMLISYRPTLKAYRLAPWWLLTLPLAAVAYMGMTLLSAWQHRRGGPAWHGRHYGTEAGSPPARQP